MDLRTVKQVSLLTGVSIRTLRFYDEIGLLKPTEVTEAGYRLYDQQALEVLQQILFFRELDFTLKEIKAIMESPQFDRRAAMEKQRELLQAKRDRYDRLLGLLDKQIKGETCMEFQEFDLREYFRMLTDFKKTHTDEIVQRLGSVECFDEMVDGLRAQEKELFAMAEKQYGSLEAYTKAAEKNVQNFLSHGPTIPQSEVSGRVEKTEALTKRLTADLSKDVASPEIQEIVQELVRSIDESNKGMDVGENYWRYMAEFYGSNPTFVSVTDQKYGPGAARYLSLALGVYLDRQ